MRNRRRFTSTLGGMVAVVTALGFMAYTPAWSQFSEGNTVTFNGQPVFTINCAAGGFTAERRAWQAQDAIDNALVRTEDATPESVAVERKNNAYIVTLGGYYITTADSASAQAADKTPEELANHWADCLRNKLSDSEATEAYVAKLVKDHNVGTTVSYVEKNTMVGELDRSRFNLVEGLISFHPNDKTKVTAVLNRDVEINGYELPENTVLTGKVMKDSLGNEYIKFNTADTPDKKQLALNDVYARTILTTNPPHHLVAEEIPANHKQELREAANVGIGAAVTNIAVLDTSPNKVAESLDDDEEEDM